MHVFSLYHLKASSFTFLFLKIPSTYLPFLCDIKISFLCYLSINRWRSINGFSKFSTQFECMCKAKEKIGNERCETRAHRHWTRVYLGKWEDTQIHTYCVNVCVCESIRNWPSKDVTLKVTFKMRNPNMQNYLLSFRSDVLYIWYSRYISFTCPQNIKIYFKAYVH